MARGVNRADPLHQCGSRQEPCVFISHQKKDISECERIAEYLLNAEDIDIYLDKYDEEHKYIQKLEMGIFYSTHMICVVSTATLKSHWVPFKVGYRYGHSKRIPLGILTLKDIRDIKDANLPDYMKIIKNVIRGIGGLNKFISELKGKDIKTLENQKFIKPGSFGHPLSNILNWLI